MEVEGGVGIESVLTTESSQSREATDTDLKKMELGIYGIILVILGGGAPHAGANTNVLGGASGFLARGELVSVIQILPADSRTNTIDLVDSRMIPRFPTALAR